MANLNNNSQLNAEQIIREEIGVVNENPAIIKGNGCAACHVLFKIKESMQISEQDAADLLSEVLQDNSALNDQFILMVENIHMKARMMGMTFSIKSRDAKDRYIDSQFKNALEELMSDSSVHGTEIVMRRLILSNVALIIAQNLGIDYHAAIEELYYYMRKRDEETHATLMKLIKSVLDRSKYK